MRIIFLNSNQAKSGLLDGKYLPKEYVQTCKFLGCGVIDRTSSLDLGFEAKILDPIPEISGEHSRFPDLCSQVASSIVALAEDRSQPVRVLWSGGIDSTTALIALMRHTDRKSSEGQLEIVLSRESIEEYPLFYSRYIEGKYPVIEVTSAIPELLDTSAVYVTGEHGDQLFGSYLLKEPINRGESQQPYDKGLPRMLREFFGNPKPAQRVFEYLEPHIKRAPVPIRTLFDSLWWINFSLKWQHVGLRLQAFCGDRAQDIHGATRHFFSDPRFQVWSLRNPAERNALTWVAYKDAAKRYILDFTCDADYYNSKCKEMSLKQVIVSPSQRDRYRTHIFMRDDFIPVINLVEREDACKSLS